MRLSVCALLSLVLLVFGHSHAAADKISFTLPGGQAQLLDQAEIHGIESEGGVVKLWVESSDGAIQELDMRQVNAIQFGSGSTAGRLFDVNLASSRGEKYYEGVNVVSYQMGWFHARLANSAKLYPLHLSKIKMMDGGYDDSYTPTTSVNITPSQAALAGVGAGAATGAVAVSASSQDDEKSYWERRRESRNRRKLIILGISIAISVIIAIIKAAAGGRS